MANRESKTVIVGDIGGTNSRFAIYEVGSALRSRKPAQLVVKDLKEIYKQSYQNRFFSSFTEVCNKFLSDAAVNDNPPLLGCFAMAGPVHNNQVKMSNVPEIWRKDPTVPTADGDELAKTLGIKRIILVNDFVGTGYGVLTLNEETECIKLRGDDKVKSSPIACIGAGTGLGQCFLTPDHNGDYKCFPSEGGHAEYAPRNELDILLLAHLKQKFNQRNRVSVERVVSGMGLENIYEFLCQTMQDEVNSEVFEKIKNTTGSKGALIAENQQNCKVCKRVMQIFATSYGAETGAVALKLLPYGGMYLTGGLTPKNIDLIKEEDGPFMTAFLDKGRVSDMLKPIPLYAVMVEDLGVRGALYLAYQKVYNLSEAEEKKSISRTPIVGIILTVVVLTGLLYTSKNYKTIFFEIKELSKNYKTIFFEIKER